MIDVAPEVRFQRNGAARTHPGVVYFYAPDRAGVNAETFLTGFDGILQIDGYTGYNRLTQPSRKGGTPIRVAHCWAHARRKLEEVFDRDGAAIAAVRHCARTNGATMAHPAPHRIRHWA